MSGVGVRVREGEAFEAALKRFTRRIKDEGVLTDVRNNEAFEKPSEKRKRKAVAARKRSQRRAAE